MFIKLCDYFCPVLFITLVHCYYEEEQKPIHVTASVGDYVIFNCYVDFPQTIPIPHKIVWKKEVSSK